MDQENKPIKIYIRKRPVDDADEEQLDILERKSWETVLLKWRNQEKEYTFDYVFDSDATQLEISKWIIRPLVQHSLAGNNSTIFAYGETGSGKTYTLIGEDPITAGSIELSTIGLLPRAAIQLFDRLRQIPNDSRVCVSIVEIYNEEVRDLLFSQDVSKGHDEDKTICEPIRIEDVSEHEVSSLFEFDNLMNIALYEQQIIETNLERQSSMTHTIYIITITIKEEATSMTKVGKLIFVDLAGSKSFAKYEDDVVTGETIAVKKSFLALEEVIHAVAQHSDKIPYLESELTNLLRTTFEVNSKVAIIANVCSDLEAYEETTNTLEYVSKIHSAVIEMQNLKIEQMNGLDTLENKVINLRQDLNTLIVGDEFVVDPDNMCKISPITTNKALRIENLFNEFDKLENDCVVLQEQYFICIENLTCSPYTEDEDVEKLRGRIVRKLWALEKLLAQIAGLREYAHYITNACGTSSIQQERSLQDNNLGPFEDDICRPGPSTSFNHPPEIPPFDDEPCCPGPSNSGGLPPEVPPFEDELGDPCTSTSFKFPPKIPPFEDGSCRPSPSSSSNLPPKVPFFEDDICCPDPPSCDLSPEIPPFETEQYCPVSDFSSRAEICRSGQSYSEFGRPDPSHFSYGEASVGGTSEFAEQLWRDHPMHFQSESSDSSTPRVESDESHGCRRRKSRKDHERKSTRMAKSTSCSEENTDKCIRYWSQKSKAIKSVFGANYLEYCNFLEVLIYQLLLMNKIKHSVLKQFVDNAVETFFAQNKMTEGSSSFIESDTPNEECIEEIVGDMVQSVQEKLKQKKDN